MTIVSSAATCTIPEVDNASWQVLGKNSVLIGGNTVIAGSFINYTCDFGYEIIHYEEGPVIPLNCTDDGKFDKKHPICAGITLAIANSLLFIMPRCACASRDIR